METVGQWHEDPWKRHDYRYWNGSEWTDQVANDGIVSTDPVNGPPPPPVEEPRQTPPMPPANLGPGGVIDSGWRQSDYRQGAYAPPDPYGQPGTVHPRVLTTTTVVPKSPLVAFVLTFFFGPFGMLYTTVSGAVIMLFASFFFALFTLGASLLITWPICIIWGVSAAGKTQEIRTQHIIE